MRDGQDAGELLLDIEARIGELLPSAEEAQKLSHKIPRSGLPRSGPHQKVLPEGITERKAHQARTIKAHPDIVARDFLQKEMAGEWEVVSKFIHDLFQSKQSFANARSQGIGWQTILKFLGGSWKAWEVQLWTTVDRSKRASHSGSPVNGGPCED